MSYACPTELSVALQIAAEGGGKVIAGGTDVYPALRQGQRPTQFLDVTRIRGLSDIVQNADGFRIGAGVTWTQIIKADLPPAFDGLKQAAREVGSVQIQNAGTIAGNLCNASPAADGVPALLTLDASVELQSASRGMRVVPLSDFLQGPRQTLLAADELLTAIVLPPVPQNAGAAFEKLGSRKYLVISITMVAVVVTCDAAGRIIQAAIAVGACSPVAQRLAKLEADVIGARPATIVVTPEHLAPLTPLSDVRGNAAFRLDVVAEQCARAVQRAAR